jgi:hypothetical protein
LPETLVSRQVGKASLDVWNRAKAASPTKAKTSSTKPFPCADAYLRQKVDAGADPNVHIPPATSKINSDDDFAVAPERKKKKFVSAKGVAKVRSRSHSPASLVHKQWSDFGANQDMSPESEAALAAGALPTPHVQSFQVPVVVSETEGGEVRDDAEDDDEGEGDATRYDVLNASAASLAQHLPTHDDAVHIDLGNADGSTMARWWDTFMTGSRGGGFLARSLFSAAAQDSALGSHKWVGPTSVTQKKGALSDMRIKFLEWTEVPATNEWVRSKLFNIVVTNPKTYNTLKV